MALTAYETLTTALLQAPSSPVPLIATATLDSYINIARNQVAADGECIRDVGQLTLVNGQQQYSFSAITLENSGTNGYQSALVVRSALLGLVNLEIRGWEWFAAYYLTKADAFGDPQVMSQQGQGTNGTLSFYPIPQNVQNVVTFDTVILPVNLTSDSTPEAIPALWQDAVPFYAAWLAMQSLQRQADAEVMLRRYSELVLRGRQLATPTELPDNLPGGAGAAMASAKTILSARQQGQG